MGGTALRSPRRPSEEAVMETPRRGWLLICAGTALIVSSLLVAPGAIDSPHPGSFVPAVALAGGLPE